MPYSLSELASFAGVTPRTVRYYISQGLLPAPEGAGPRARYGDDHLALLRLIKKMQALHLPLAEIRAQLTTPRPEPAADQFDLRVSAASMPLAPEPGTGGAGESAVDYVRGLLGGQAPVMRSEMLVADLARAQLDEADETLPPTGESVRSQWDRVRLAPDIELHVRRPLSRPLNKKVEHLIRLARQLLEEDQP